jgi:hypothetical protein
VVPPAVTPVRAAPVPGFEPAVTAVVPASPAPAEAAAIPAGLSPWHRKELTALRAELVELKALLRKVIR